MMESADIQTAAQLNEQLQTIFETYPDINKGELWPGNLDYRPVADGGLSVSVRAEDGQMSEYSVWLARGADGNFNNFVLLTDEQASQFYSDAMDELTDSVAKDRFGTYARDNDGEPVLGPDDQPIYIHTRELLGDKPYYFPHLSSEQQALFENTFTDDQKQTFQMRSHLSSSVNNTTRNFEALSPNLQDRINEHHAGLNRVTIDAAALEDNEMIRVVPQPALETPPEPQPDPAPQALPNTELDVTTLAGLAALDFTDQLGGVSKREIDSDLAREARSTVLTELRDIREQFTAYYNTDDPAARQALEQDIIESVQAMPDGYKAVGVAFVRDTLERDAPLSHDAYRHQAGLLYLNDRGAESVKNKLYPEPEPMGDEFNRAAPPQPVDISAYLLSDPMPDSPVDVERELHGKASWIESNLRSGELVLSDEQFGTLVEQFAEYDAAFPPDQQYGTLLTQAREGGADYDRRSIFETGRERQQGVRELQDEHLAQENIGRTLEGLPHIPDSMKETLIQIADPDMAPVMLEQPAAQADMLDAVGFAAVGGEDPVTVTMEDGKSYVVCEVSQANGDTDYMLMTPHQLRLKGYEAMTEDIFDLNNNIRDHDIRERMASHGMDVGPDGVGEAPTLSGFQVYGGYARAIDTAQDEIFNRNTDYNMENGLEALPPNSPVRAAVMRATGAEEQQVEQVESEIKVSMNSAVGSPMQPA